MIPHGISDWDDAYANSAHIAGGERWPDAWSQPARLFREAMLAAGRAELDIAYGEKLRNRLDLFLPLGRPKGLVVFVHGGYWMALDKSFWSHLARGSVENGHAVAMPSYTLCPDIRIAGIAREIGLAIVEAGSRVDGPIRLTGHSAGGHLVARMISRPSPLPESIQRRVVHTVPIAGLPDLRPLLRTSMNATLRIDKAEALAESPALLEPIEGARVTAWVGAAERSEFIRQSAIIANIWTGLGARTAFHAEPDRHHFSVIDGLADPGHPLTQALLAG